MNLHSWSLRAAAVGVLLAGSSSAALSAEENFFQGKTITIIVGFEAGGGYDAYARLVGDHLGKHIAGNPTFIVENMPGGGGRKSIIYIGSAAPKDGTVIAIVPAPIAFDSVQSDLPDRLDVATLNYLGRLDSVISAEVTWHTSATKTIEDAKQRETTLASSGIASNSSFIPRMLNGMIGTKFKVVEGYKGIPDMAKAMESGEVEGTLLSATSITTMHPDWATDGSVNFLWLVATTRSPQFPGVPSLVEFAENDDQKQLLWLAASTADVGRPVVAPPGVPADRVEVLRRAFDAMIKDPDFLADANTRKLSLDPATGEAVQEAVRTTMSTPPAVVETLKKILAGDS
jgi:tripartite-type tricarboxylate transporter receptor subunit TctC